MPRVRKLAPSRSRPATRELRRQQLIESTIDSIAKRGFAETTLANVADGAGLSRGIVNFHFRSKDALLVETLRYLTEDYRGTWMRAVERAGPDPADRLWAMVEADFDPAICNRKKIAVWYAFWGEAKSRPTYLEVCDAADQAYTGTMRELCRQVAEAGGYDEVEPQLVADGLNAMLNGMWLNLLLDPAGFDRAANKRTCLAYLASSFPGHFTPTRCLAARERAAARRSA